MPGYGLPLGELIARIGLEDARELWSLSKQGADYVRANATEDEDSGDCAQRRGAGGFQRRGRRCPDQPAANARRGFRYRSGGMAGRPRPRRTQDQIIISTASIIPGRFRSTAANISMALRRWRSGPARGFSRTRRSSASIRPAFASGSSRRRRGCARRISCSPATSISARTLRRLSETLLPVWRYAAVTAPLGERLAEAMTFQGSVTDSDGIDHFRIVGGRPPDVGQPRNHLGRTAAAFRARHRAQDPHDLSRSSASRRLPRYGAGPPDRPCTACRRSASCVRACG